MIILYVNYYKQYIQKDYLLDILLIYKFIDIDVYWMNILDRNAYITLYIIIYIKYTIFFNLSVFYK